MLIFSSFFHHFHNTIQMTSQKYYLISVLQSNLPFDTPVSLLTLPFPLSGMTLSCPQPSLSPATSQVSAQEDITYFMNPFMILHPLHGIRSCPQLITAFRTSVMFSTTKNPFMYVFPILHMAFIDKFSGSSPDAA